MPNLRKIFPNDELSEDRIPEFLTKRCNLVPEAILEMKLSYADKKINPLEAWLDILMHITPQKTIPKKDFKNNLLPGEIFIKLEYFASRWVVSKSSVSRFVSDLSEKKLIETRKYKKSIIAKIPINHCIINLDQTHSEQLIQPIQSLKKQFIINTSHINTNKNNNINETLLKQLSKLNSEELLGSLKIHEPKKSKLLETYDETYIKWTMLIAESKNKLTAGYVISALEKEWFKDEIERKHKEQIMRNLNIKYKKDITVRLQEFQELRNNFYKSISENQVIEYKYEYLATLQANSPEVYKEQIQESQTHILHKSIKNYIFNKLAKNEIKDLSEYFNIVYQNKIQVKFMIYEFGTMPETKNIAKFKLDEEINVNRVNIVITDIIPVYSK